MSASNAANTFGSSPTACGSATGQVRGLCARAEPTNPSTISMIETRLARKPRTTARYTTKVRSLSLIRATSPATKAAIPERVIHVPSAITIGVPGANPASFMLKTSATRNPTNAAIRPPAHFPSFVFGIGLPLSVRFAASRRFHPRNRDHSRGPAARGCSRLFPYIARPEDRMPSEGSQAARRPDLARLDKLLEQEQVFELLGAGRVGHDVEVDAARLERLLLLTHFPAIRSQIASTLFWWMSRSRIFSIRSLK